MFGNKCHHFKDSSLLHESNTNVLHSAGKTKPREKHYMSIHVLTLLSWPSLVAKSASNLSFKSCNDVDSR